MITSVLWLEKLRNGFVKWLAQGQLLSQGIESLSVGLPSYAQAMLYVVHWTNVAVPCVNSKGLHAAQR